MYRATQKDKELIVNILLTSFADNKSVNYIVKQDGKRNERLKKLFEYSFDICYSFGEILLSDDKKGCALIVMPDKKKITLKSMLLDARLIVFCMGLKNTVKAMKRETIIKRIHPKGLIYYLWFIGVNPDEQNKGVGSNLLQDVINEAALQKRNIHLETSTLKNIPWYEKHGFTIYKELDFGYKLFCMKREY